MSALTHVYAWGNNPMRATLKGRPCRILARGAMGTVVVEFTDGKLPESAALSARALRRVERPQAAGGEDERID